PESAPDREPASQGDSRPRMSHWKLVHLVVDAAFGIRSDFQIGAQSLHFLKSAECKELDLRCLLRWQVRVSGVKRHDEAIRGQWIEQKLLRCHDSNTSNRPSPLSEIRSSMNSIGVAGATDTSQ